MCFLLCIYLSEAIRLGMINLNHCQISNMRLQFLFQILLSILVFLGTTSCILASQPMSIRSFGGMRRVKETGYLQDLPPDFIAYNYTQTLDHFNYRPESYATFQQKYILNFKHWGGANTSSPIFVYVGAELPIIFELDGFIVDLASRFNGMLLYIEVCL